MPGLSTRQLKPGMGSSNQRRKISDQNQQRLLKTVRVIYLDPDATDSSSGDEQGTLRDKQTSGGVMRCVKKVCMFESFPRVKRNPASGANSFTVCENNSKLPTQNGMRLKSKYAGVRHRESGRWGAEIQDPIRGARKWLGTYDTELEAHCAYERKRLEFEALLKKQKRVNTSTATQSNLHIARCVSEGITGLSPHLSPSSVLDVSNTTPHVGDTKASDNVNKPSSDHNVKEAKDEKFDIEDSDLAFADGVKIALDELKPEDFLRCNLGDLADLPDSSSLLDLDKEDMSWLNEVLMLCGFED